MSKRFLIWGMAALLVAAFAGAAQADVPRGNHDGVNLLDRIVAQAAPAPAEAQRVNASADDVTRPGTPDAGCQTLNNSCDIPFYIWSVPGTTNSRIAIAEGFDPDPGFAATPCSVQTVGVFLYDWVGDPIDVDVSVCADDGFGLPGTELARVTVPSATVQAGIDAFAYTVVDFTSYDIVVPAGERFHVVVDVPTATPGTNGVFTLSDGGTDDVGACPEGAANTKGSVFYTTVGYWESHAEHFAGFQFGSMFYADVCCEAVPPECFSLTNSCNIPFYIWSVPGTTNSRVAIAEGFDLDPTGSRECTLKTAYVFLYDWIGDPIDVDVSIWDDAAGLPGTELARVTLPSATVQVGIDAFDYCTVDFSAYNLTAPPGGRLHVVVDVPTATPGVDGIFTLSDGGTDDAAACPEGANNTKGSVYYTTVGYWESHADHFAGFQFGSMFAVDICCPPLLFELCTPGSQTDWPAQGNGYARTNATTASISNLCGLTTAWSHDFTGTVSAHQPVIAGDYVLVTSTDNVHCYLRDGTPVWSKGSFPYIVGDLRGSPTVDLDLGLVFFGGAGAQAFTAVNLATGAVVWSRNLGGTDPPYTPLNPGQTNFTPAVVADGFVYLTQETGYVYKLDVATGLDAAGSPITLPDAVDGSFPYNGLTSDGTKLWVGTANTLGSDGNIHQIDMATFVVDWTLNSPGMTFYPASADFYDPEGFPGSMAYEGGILYYHSQIRNDANGFLHYPQTGSLGAIDVTGVTPVILWVNDANSQTIASPGTVATSTWNFSGPALGPGFVYLTSRGLFSGTTEQDGVSAWNKTLGTRIWYQGYTSLGVSGGVEVLDDVRSDAPATVFCQPDGTPYLFVGNVGGVWRLFNGNTGDIVWERTMTERVRGTAVTDDFVVTVVRTGSAAGGGSVVAFTVGADRPRLQVDSQYVFRTATPGDGLMTDDIVAAFQNTGCVALNVSSYGVIPATLRVTSEHPILKSASERLTATLAGYDAFLDAPSWKTAPVVDDVDESLVRTFENVATAAADPLFLSVNTGAGAVAPGAAQTLNVSFDETGLTNNTGYVNYIEIASDDPDFYPQDPTGAVLGLPTITFNLFIGCPDASAYLTGGLGETYVTNYGATGDGGTNGFVVNGNAWYYDGGWAMVVEDSSKWAFDGCSVGGYPRRAGEWGPTLPCGLSIVAANYDSPLGAGADAVEEVTFNMIDLASTNGFFTASTRQCGGVFVEVKRVMSTDAAFGDFAMTAITLTNEADGGDDMPDVYFSTVTDWDVAAGTDNWTAVYPNGSYALHDGGVAQKAGSNHYGGYVRLDADAAGSAKLAAGGAPVFLMADIQDDQGHGENAFRMHDLTRTVGPDAYADWVDANAESGVVVDNTDCGAMFIPFYTPNLAEGTSQTFYFAVYQVDNGVNGLAWSDAAGFDASVAEIQCRAKAFAGFGKGDVNCDGVLDLADVVLLGNILDGLTTAAGGGIYAADVNGDNAYTQADYDLLYDVIAGIQPASNMANAWRF